MVGGKCASLGELIASLQQAGVRVPDGFAVTVAGYRHLLDAAGIEEKLRVILAATDPTDLASLQKGGREARTLLQQAPLPKDLEGEIAAAYAQLCTQEGGGTPIAVAVRSSATAEDLPDASFAGQQDTYLNVVGLPAVLDACRRCFASLFTDRAISYRHGKGYDHFAVGLAIAIQKMVRADAACSGVLFTLDTESGFPDVVLINAAWGLGELLVQGRVNPDEYFVFKGTLRPETAPIVGKKRGIKAQRIVFAPEGGVISEEVPLHQQERFALTDAEILQLARWGMAIEAHYSKLAKTHRPMDIEWAKDGDGTTVGTGHLYVVQARPETVHSGTQRNVLRDYVLSDSGLVLATGQAVGARIGQGEANVIRSVEDIGQFSKGQVLVTTMTDPDWEPVMKIAGAIVTEQGGRTCHAAIISRELGIPCVIGTGNATRVVVSGQPVTVVASEGETGTVYDGLLRYKVVETDLSHLPPTHTKIMMNVGIPEQAFKSAMIPCDGVGLARQEFIINDAIGIHPLALLDYEQLKARGRREQKVAGIVEDIDRITHGYEDKAQFFVDTLARGVGRICAAFYPKDVIVRLSDFKSNEYANLIGGSIYEPRESNPMIGWRGASRYYDPKYRRAFELECKALIKVRTTMGLTNLKVMVPFCRTPEEGKRVIATMAEFGLRQHESGLEVYVMAEIPSNVILADAFSDIFDGFSIGSNDLTQLTLGLDRDSHLVAHLYDERNEGVKRLVKQLVTMARSRGRKVGICGQAPSDFPDFAAFLVEQGIDSMSLNADTVLRTRIEVARQEQELANAGKGR